MLLTNYIKPQIGRTTGEVLSCMKLKEGTPAKFHVNHF